MLKLYTYLRGIMAKLRKINACVRTSGPGCSKLTMSLVKNSNMNISNTQIFLLKKNVRKASPIFFQQKISVYLVMKW